jgi:hypothetical protein
MKFNGFSTFLYRLADEFHLVLHFVQRLRKAPLLVRNTDRLWTKNKQNNDDLKCIDKIINGRVKADLIGS